MRILYVARDLGNEKNGASSVMKRNREALRHIVEESNIKDFLLPKSSIKNVVSSIIHTGSYGVTPEIEKSLLSIISIDQPDLVFVESSSNGSIFQNLKKIGIKSICFAHNVDTNLSKAELTSRLPLIAIPKYILTRINEKRTAKYTDTLICLTQRDSEGFKNTFGRKADYIFPITFPLKQLSEILPTQESSVPHFLFVGSDFFPNVEGIKWFITEVAPHVKMNFRIVGGCCQNPIIKNLPLPPNVILAGYADDLSIEYRNASGVIAPIFKGSGMKTKTVEAMSYGKSIFGTDEAFAGIDVDYSKIGGLCNTAEDFIKKLNSFNGNYINEYTRMIFESHFSDEIFVEKLRKCIEETLASNQFEK